ncbi:HEAT repeat domain-containing protein [Streptomyces violascens]|uniref:HEAT repeat domain-containing protein n=1 Tax=Streptomyces violascens TaxID=67381 RepID=UPI00378E05EB
MNVSVPVLFSTHPAHSRPSVPQSRRHSQRPPNDDPQKSYYPGERGVDGALVATSGGATRFGEEGRGGRGPAMPSIEPGVDGDDGLADDLGSAWSALRGGWFWRRAVRGGGMNVVFAALEALTNRDPNRRDVAADTLGDLLRGNALDADTPRLVVGRLVSLAINESETKVRESALNSISEAFNRHGLPLDLVEPLATAMPTMEHELLEHALYILGATHDPRARSLIEPFLLHPNSKVRGEAQLATAVPEGPTHNS